MGCRERYLQACAVADDPFLEDEIPEWGNDDAAQQTVHAKLPGLLTLSGASIDTCHQEDDVQGRKGIEYLGHVSEAQGARRGQQA
jgi:hypothetical protein